MSGTAGLIRSSRPRPRSPLKKRNASTIGGYSSPIPPLTSERTRATSAFIRLTLALSVAVPCARLVSRRPAPRRGPIRLFVHRRIPLPLWIAQFAAKIRP